MTVTDIIGEGIDIHGLYTGEERQKRIYELLEIVGLNKEHASRFPHEFSGGQRQRIGIARALAIEPKFIVCDEPISALDVSIQAQVVNLLMELQQKLGLTYLFIAHDLSMVKHISDRIAVMYLGSIMELTTSDELYDKPLHPYTKALLSAVPIPDPEVERSRKRIILEGDVPSPINPPPHYYRLFFTYFPTQFTSSLELTSRWRIDWTWHIPFKNNSLSASLYFWVWNLAWSLQLAMNYTISRYIHILKHYYRLYQFQTQK